MNMLLRHLDNHLADRINHTVYLNTDVPNFYLISFLEYHKDPSSLEIIPSKETVLESFPYSKFCELNKETH